MNEETMVDIRIRKVKMLKDPAHREAILIGLKDDDLIIVKTTVEKIDGSPIEYLQDRLRPEAKQK